jgi:hypothetical protein
MATLYIRIILPVVFLISYFKGTSFVAQYLKTQCSRKYLDLGGIKSLKSQWPLVPRCISSWTARLLRLWLRILPETCIHFFGAILCRYEEPISRPRSPTKISKRIDNFRN